MNRDLYFMKRALELSRQGIGQVNPNPLVGAVIVRDDRIIGEGYHERYGGVHAEINAINNAVEDVDGATMYVTLEPCSHFGKTPPCAHEIVRRKIKRVVAGIEDPNPLVSGKGLEYLKSNHVEVFCGLLQEEIEEQNEIFLKYIRTKMPFIILKTAMTLDGKIATVSGDSKWITNETSRAYVHETRGKVSAVMVGVNTVVRDDPFLTVRTGTKPSAGFVRVIVDSTGKTPIDANVLKDTSTVPTLIATTDGIPVHIRKAYEKRGARCLILPRKDGRVDLKILMEELGRMNIDSVLIEGGGTLNWTALQEGLVDKVMFFIAPRIVGGADAITPVEGEGKMNMKESVRIGKRSIRVFDEDILIEGYVKGMK